MLGPRGTAAMYWPIVPVPGDCEDGEVGRMKCGRRKSFHSYCIVACYVA
jgi:hypothetical protein